MLLRKQSWQTSVKQKLEEQATVAKGRQNSSTDLLVWKYNSGKINTEGNKLQLKLPDENTIPKHSLNLKHAKKNPTHQPTEPKSTLEGIQE